MQCSRLGLQRDHVWRRSSRIRPGRCSRRLVTRCDAQASSRFYLPEKKAPDPPIENKTSVPDSVELLDKALAAKDLDTSWNLMLGFLPPPGVIHPQDSSLERVMEHRPKIFLEKCLERQRTDLVLAFFRRFPPNSQLFAVAMKQCLKQGQYTHVCELMEVLVGLGVAPDVYAYNTHISALSKLGIVEEARAVFDTAVQTGHDSIYVYNTMLDAYARVSDIAHSQEIWMLIHEAGLKPDAVSYVGILRAWGSQGDFEKFRELYAELQGMELKPMPHTFTILFDSITKTAAKVDAEWLIQMVQSMKKEAVDMNRHILSSMVNAFSLQDLNAEHIRFVFSTVREFRQQMSPGHKVYCTVLNFCCRRGIPQRAMDVWKMLKDDGMTPNGHVYSAALKACWMMKQHQREMKFVTDVARELKTDWKRMTDKKTAQGEMRVAFNALLHFYAECRNADDAWIIFQFMCRHGPSPNHITYNTVLSALVPSEAPSQMDRILEDMEMAGFHRDVTTYGILLNGCADHRDVHRAIALMKEMHKEGMKPTVECYTALLDACVKEGSAVSISAAFDWFHYLKQKDLQPSAVTYGCMFLAYQAKGDVDGAFALYKEACKCGISPSDKCHNILISMCTQVGRLDDALDLIKVLVRKHGDIAEDTMNSITRALSAEYFPRSLVLLRMMKHRAMVPSPETYHCLVLACCRESDIQRAFELYREMISRRLLISPDVGSALIKSLSKAGEVLAALRVTNCMFEKAGLPSIDPSIIRKGWKPPPARRKERILFSSLPSAQSLGSLIVGLVQKNHLKTAMYIFRQICVLNNASGVTLLAKDVRQVFELLIESSCAARRVDWAIEVFLKWHIAKEKIYKIATERKKDTK